MAGCVSELEGVLEQIGYRRREQLSVRVDDNAILDRFDRKLVAASLGFDDGGDLHFLDELREQNRLASLHGRLEAYFGERAIDEIVHAFQAAIEECSGTAVMATVPPLRMPNDSIAVLRRLRSSCARAPMRSRFLGRPATARAVAHTR